jgi:hypothetical protein
LLLYPSGAFTADQIAALDDAAAAGPGESVPEESVPEVSGPELSEPGPSESGLPEPGPFAAVAVDPGSRAELAAVLAERPRPRTLIHALSPAAASGAAFATASASATAAAPATASASDADFAEAQRLGFYSVLALVGALAEDPRPGPVDLLLCTRGAVEAVGGDLTAPQQATLLGLGPVVGQEFGDLSCRVVDLDAAADPEAAAAAVLAESAETGTEPVALRGGMRWVRSFEPLRIGPVAPRRRAVPDGAAVLITGGLGTVGSAIAEHLAVTRGANLVLLARTALPPEPE